MQNAAQSHSPIGNKRWAIAEGYIPSWSHGQAPEMESHEAVCILNAGEQDADIDVTVFYEDREPIGPYQFKVAARRTRHLRFNDFTVPRVIPRGVPFSSVIESSVPVVVQYTRLDSRQDANALLSTIAFPAG